MISYQYLCVNISQESFSTLLSDSPYSFRGVFSSRSTSAAFPAITAPETDAAPSDNDSSAQNILIAYFSNTGNTEEAAQQIADLTGGTVLDNGLSVSRNHAADAQSDLADWISSLDIL